MKFELKRPVIIEECYCCEDCPNCNHCGNNQLLEAENGELFVVRGASFLGHVRSRTQNNNANTAPKA